MPAKNETEETTRLFSVGFLCFTAYSNKEPTETGRRFRRKTEKQTEPLSVPVYFRLTTPVAT